MLSFPAGWPITGFKLEVGAYVNGIDVTTQIYSVQIQCGEPYPCL